MYFSNECLALDRLDILKKRSTQPHAYTEKKSEKSNFCSFYTSILQFDRLNPIAFLPFSFMLWEPGHHYQGFEKLTIIACELYWRLYMENKYNILHIFLKKLQDNTDI